MKHTTILLSTLVLLGWILGGTAVARAQDESASFSCQAEVSTTGAGKENIRDRARQALLTDGVRQAVASLLTPEDLKRLERPLRKDIYTKADDYVMTYQVLSEQTEADSLKMTGEITVSLPVLRTDLERLGARVVEQAPAAATSYTNGSQTAPTGSSSSPGTAVATVPEVKEPPPASGREVLWAVTERWRSGWVLPRENDYEASPFFAGVTQEISDYGWDLVAPRPDSLNMQPDGNAAVEDVLALAGAMSIPTVIYGRVTGRPVAEATTLVSTDLKVIDVASNQSIGTIHKEWQAVGVSDPEAAVALANLVAPDIDQVLSRHPRSTSAAGSDSNAAPAPASAFAPPATSRPAPEGTYAPAAMTGAVSETAVIPAAPDEEVIEIHGPRPYAVWDALQTLLTEHSGALRLKALEMIPDAIRAHVSGVDLNLFSTFNGYRLNDRMVLQVDRLSEEDRTIYLSTSQAAPPAEPGVAEQSQP